MELGQVGPETPEESQTTDEEVNTEEGEKYDGGEIPRVSPSEQDEN